MTATKVFDGLTEAQADGHACVACGEDHLKYFGATVPVGFSLTGSQVFACKRGCVVCGPGCCSPAPGVHDHCPGPRAGAEVVRVR